MSTKTYQGNTKHLSLLVTVKGVNKRITLLGGMENGTYITNDIAEQKAIENTERFKSGEIKIINDTVEPKDTVESKDTVEVINVSVEKEAVTTEKTEPKETSNTTLIKEAKDYPEAKRVQDAQRILVKEYGAKAKEVAVKKDILEFAKNINVTFSSLQ